MAKWVVIGGFGFIGSRLVKTLLREEEEVVVIDDVSFASIPVTVDRYREKRYEFDYRTKFYTKRGGAMRVAAIQKSVASSSIDVGKLDADYIVYAAGPSVPEEVHRNVQRGANQMIGGVLNTLEHLVNQDQTKNIVYLSSSMVYGDFQYTPIKEEHSTLPLEIYGTYKLACENLFRNYYQRHGIPYTVLRLSGVYGPGDGNGRVIEKLMDNALKGVPLTVRDNMVDFTHVDDVVQGIQRAAYRAQSNTYNLASGRGNKISKVAEHISDKLVFGTEINYLPEEDWRPRRGALSIEKAHVYLGYRPKYTLEEGLDSYFEYLKRRQEIIYD